MDPDTEDLIVMLIDASDRLVVTLEIGFTALRTILHEIDLSIQAVAHGVDDLARD